jgi:hypothetical protein
MLVSAPASEDELLLALDATSITMTPFTTVGHRRRWIN